MKFLISITLSLHNSIILLKVNMPKITIYCK